MQLREYYYESGNAPHEALGRAARRLSTGGALYLGGGIGIEKTSTKQGDRYSITQASSSKPETFTGPLSAAMRGFAIAGGSTAADTPGGATKVTDPAAAARLRELIDEERDLERRIERSEARLAAKQQGGLVPPSGNDMDWLTRDLAEDRRRLVQLRAERRKLIDTGKVEEVEQERPGTNFTKIPAANVKKLSPIISKYRKAAKPFTECVADQVKHGLSEDHAKRRCAVVKDLGRGTTRWRTGSKKVSEAEAVRRLDAAVRESCERLDLIDAQLGAGAAVELAELAGGLGNETMDALGEMAFDDLGLLFLAGHPLGETWQQVREAPLREDFNPLQPRDFLGRWKDTLKGLKPGGSTKLPDGITVTRKPDGFHVTGGGGTRNVAQRAAGGPPDTKVDTPEQAFQLATVRSARSTKELSIGGKKSYDGLKDFERAQDGGTGVTRADQANNISPHAPSEAPRKDREAYELLRSGRSLSVDEQRAAYAHAMRHGDDEAQSILTGALRKQKKQRVEGLPRIGKTPRQRAISVGATRRAQQVAQDRHRRIEAERAKGEVSTYALKTADGRHIRQATKVTLPNGEEIRFTEKMSKAEALRQAEQQMQRRRGGGRVTRPLPDTTPGIADSPGESARGIEQERRRQKFDPPKATPEKKRPPVDPSDPRVPKPGLSQQEMARQRVDVKRKLRKASPGETVTLENGTKIEKMSNGNYIANGHNVGPNLDRASEVATASERVLKKRAERSAAKGGDSDQVLGVPIKRARQYAAKFSADTQRLEPPERLEPTDENLMKKLSGSARKPRPDELAAIRKVFDDEFRDAAGGSKGETAEQTRKRAQDTTDADDAKLLKMGPAKSLTTPERHQLKIARDTLRMSDSGSKIMGGMSKDEARKFIRRIAGK